MNISNVNNRLVQRWFTSITFPCAFALSEWTSIGRMKRFFFFCSVSRTDHLVTFKRIVLRRVVSDRSIYTINKLKPIWYGDECETHKIDTGTMCDQYLDQNRFPLDRWKFIDAKETIQTAENNKKLYRLAKRASKCRSLSNVQRLSARSRSAQIAHKLHQNTVVPLFSSRNTTNFFSFDLFVRQTDRFFRWWISFPFLNRKQVSPSSVGWADRNEKSSSP